jgi:hypothetical protein
MAARHVSFTMADAIKIQSIESQHKRANRVEIASRCWRAMLSLLGPEGQRPCFQIPITFIW